VCLIAIGKMVGNALKAAETLSGESMSIDVWDARSCLPLDQNMLDAASRADVVLTFEDGIREGGIGSMIATQLGNTRVITHGIPTQFIAQAKPDAILARLGLDPAGIAQSVRLAIA
jgi:1-deoxy-D-xylulose-5-phosphate synthase